MCNPVKKRAMETSLLSTRETSAPMICLELEHPDMDASETLGRGQFGIKIKSGM